MLPWPLRQGRCRRAAASAAGTQPCRAVVRHDRPSHCQTMGDEMDATHGPLARQAAAALTPRSLRPVRRTWRRFIKPPALYSACAVTVAVVAFVQQAPTDAPGGVEQRGLRVVGARVWPRPRRRPALGERPRLRKWGTRSGSAQGDQRHGNDRSSHRRRPVENLWAGGARGAAEVRLRGRGGVAGVGCFRTGGRPHLFFRLHARRGRKGEPKRFFWKDCRDLDRRPVACAAEHSTWLTRVQMPAFAPELNPAGVWSSLKAPSPALAADLRGLVRIVKRKLQAIQFRPDLLDGCLAETSLGSLRAQPEYAGSALRISISECTWRSIWEGRKA